MQVLYFLCSSCVSEEGFILAGLALSLGGRDSEQAERGEVVQTDPLYPEDLAWGGGRNERCEFLLFCC